jgi:response regulator RpfG family c-di-GMP phosphodiesterase
MNENPYTILCVDDEKNILEILRRTLRKENYRILTASSGAEGLRMLRENQVSVVISDQKMPGMQGTEFLKMVKDRYPEVLTAILTGYADLETIREALNRGHISRFFLKPWNADELKLDIRDLLYEYERSHTSRAIERRVIRHILKLKKKEISLAQARRC